MEQDIYASAKSDGVLCMQTIFREESKSFRSLSSAVTAVDASLIFVARGLNIGAAYPPDYSDLVSFPTRVAMWAFIEHFASMYLKGHLCVEAT